MIVSLVAFLLFTLFFSLTKARKLYQLASLAKQIDRTALVLKVLSGKGIKSNGELDDSVADDDGFGISG